MYKQQLLKTRTRQSEPKPIFDCELPFMESVDIAARDTTLSQSKMMEMNNLLEGTTPLIRSGESSLGSSSHNLVMGFDGIFRSEKCVKLFQDFLREQNQVNYLMFWLAVNGFKKVPEPGKADHLAKIIYRSFIKSNSENPVKLSPSTIHDIKVLIDSTPILRTIFDKAHLEVESLLRTNFYPQFTKWDGASKFEFIDSSPTLPSGETATSQMNSGTHFGFHDSSPANTDSVPDVTLPNNPNVSMSSSSSVVHQASVAPLTTLTGTTMSNLVTTSAGLICHNGGTNCCLDCCPNNNNNNSGSQIGANLSSSSCLQQELTSEVNNNNARSCSSCVVCRASGRMVDATKLTSSETTSSTNLIATPQQQHLSSSKGNPLSSRMQRRGKSQENTIDHRISKDPTTGNLVKMSHHSRPKSSNANNGMSTKKGSSSAAVKSDLASRKPPEMLSPHQFAAILTRKLEELQVKQQGLKLDAQAASSSSHERSLTNNFETLRHQLLAVSGATSHQVSDLASSSQEDDPNNIIDSHVSRVFRDTREGSPSPSFSPTPLCAECGPGTSAIHHHVKSSCNTLPPRVVNGGGGHHHSGVICGGGGGKFVSSGSRRCNRFETCSNLSMSSGVDSGCFDVSSQFSTDSRESERSRLSVLNWMQTSSRENSNSNHSSARNNNNSHVVPSRGQHPGGPVRGGSSTTSRLNNRWASLSPHRNMHYSVNNCNNSQNPLMSGILMSSGCMSGGCGTPSRVPPMFSGASCDGALSNNCINSIGYNSAFGSSTSQNGATMSNNSCATSGASTVVCACGRETSTSIVAPNSSSSSSFHPPPVPSSLHQHTHAHHSQYHQKKSRSNSAERPFSGAALQVFKQQDIIPKATTSESIIGMSSTSCSQDNVNNPPSSGGMGGQNLATIAPPSFSQSAGSKTPKQPKEGGSVISQQFADSTPINEKKKSSTWSKQRTSEKGSRSHFNTCVHSAAALALFQQHHNNNDSSSLYSSEIQEDSAFDESCAEESYFSTCSSEAIKKPLSSSSQASCAGSNPTSQPPSSAASQTAGSYSGSSSTTTTTTTATNNNSTVVAYFFCGEPIPYRTVVQSKVITLSDFKSLLTRKGNYRYFFKMRSDEIEIGGIVNEEVTDDNAILPFYDGKIIGRIEKQTSV
ncbi:uncharacterized protein LOC142336466 isoform X2 [Convolutriloba macropyga]|uniref:uncharacterized protein LOC142336466 isoform X2 n=1 Tax=Convolutriloba macropyga TaxID=536237 RepID=UPI003F51FACF